MYLRNHWYVVAGAEELAAGNLLARTIMNEPMVLYRKEDGSPVALYDRCVHRQAPLSLGELVGDDLRCNYHGLRYDCSGACVHVPGQSNVPPGARVRAYPTVERHSWIWAWMGEVEKADESMIPDFHLNEAPGWDVVGENIVMRGNYQLLIDNLMDLSHLGYLHRRTIGTPEAAENGTIKSYRTEKGARVERVTRNAPLAPLWHKVKKNDIDVVDRWSIADYEPPASIFIMTASVPPGQGETDEERAKHPRALVSNFITPETDDSLHYFWRYCRNYGQNDAQNDEKLMQGLRLTFTEDTEMIEGQHQNKRLEPNFPQVDIGYDAGAIEARRILADLIAKEQGAQNTQAAE